MSDTNQPEVAKTEKKYQITLQPLDSSLVSYTNMDLGDSGMIHPDHKVVVVDLSWLIYNSRFAFESLGTIWPSGPRPTGHIYGVLNRIQSLHMMGYLVILAVDSQSFRKDVFPAYKEGRHKEATYNPKEDINSILTLACAIPNVFYCKIPGLEADDIISSYIRATNYYPLNLTVMHNDHDILQVQGKYTWIREVRDSVVLPIDRKEFIQNHKDYGYPLDFLPIWHKVIRGDSSDNISPGAPRYHRPKLYELVMELKDLLLFSELESYIEKTNATKLREHIEDLRIRHRIVLAQLKPLGQLRLCTKDNTEHAVKIAQSFQLGEYLWFLGEIGVRGASH